MKTTRGEYSYTYAYAYASDATPYAGPALPICPTNGFCGGRAMKACIDDKLYEMQPILLKGPPPDQPEKK